MSQRTYTVAFNAVADSAAMDLVEIATVRDKPPVRIAGIFIAQYGTADYGDAQAEGLGLKISRGWTTSGSGGSAYTPVPIDPFDAAASFTAEVNNTTLASAGTEVVVHSDGFNVQAGLPFWFPEGFQPYCPLSTATTFYTTIRTTAPADALSTVNGTLYLIEG